MTGARATGRNKRTAPPRVQTRREVEGPASPTNSMCGRKRKRKKTVPAVVAEAIDRTGRNFGASSRFFRGRCHEHSRARALFRRIFLKKCGPLRTWIQIRAGFSQSLCYVSPQLLSPALNEAGRGRDPAGPGSKAISALGSTVSTPKSRIRAINKGLFSGDRRAGWPEGSSTSAFCLFG